MKDIFLLCSLLSASALAEDAGIAAQTRSVEPIQGSAQSDVDGQAMQNIYDEVKTPFKYGVVVKGPTRKIMMDSPSVFRHGETWYMVHIVFDGNGYDTHLQRSSDLLVWEPLGVILPRRSGAWDSEQAAGYIALQDHRWDGTWMLQPYDGKYWMSYLGGSLKGYETDPLSIGVAWTDNPGQAKEWTRLPDPVLTRDQADARTFERNTLFKSHIIRDTDEVTGWPFIMYYNANGQSHGKERIGMAVSKDMLTWSRLGQNPVIEVDGVFAADPQVVKIGDLWVMFYFRGFSKGKKHTYNTFSCSRDLVHWTHWTGPDLVAPSEPYDKGHAHKPWVVRHEGVVYHFYCAVGEQGRVIALATSKDLKAGAATESAEK